MEKKDRLDADLWTGTFAHAGLKSNASNIHLLNKSGWGKHAFSEKATLALGKCCIFKVFEKFEALK